MSSVIEIEQASSSGIRKSSSSFVDRQDDVFGTPTEYDQVADLSNKFERMQATEPTYKPVTDLYCTGNPLSTYTKDALDTNNTVCYNQEERDSDGLGISTLPPKPKISASYAVYACQTASDALIEGIRTSVRQILSGVPKIVINGTPDEASSSVTKECGSAADLWSDMHNLHPRKLMQRHRSKAYFQPYRLVDRRHYTCLPLTVRRRRYGVSQRGSIEPGVNELTHLLEKLATNDQSTASNTQQQTKKEKWQYSPPPKYYMIRYRPSARLAQIKERSRSLNDLRLRINGSPPHQGTSNPPNTNNNSNCTQQHGSGVIQSGATGSCVLQVATGIRKLNVSE